jgi:hypothetical protein
MAFSRNLPKLFRSVFVGSRARIGGGQAVPALYRQHHGPDQNNYRVQVTGSPGFRGKLICTPGREKRSLPANFSQNIPGIPDIPYDPTGDPGMWGKWGMF